MQDTSLEDRIIINITNTNLMGNMEKERLTKICTIVLGQNFDLNFINEEVDFSKPSSIKKAYKQFKIREITEVSDADKAAAAALAVGAAAVGVGAKKLASAAKERLKKAKEALKNANTDKQKEDAKERIQKAKAAMKENIDENRAIVYNPRMIRAFIKQAEKKFPKYKGEIQQVEKDEIVFPNDPKLKDFFRGAKEVKFVLSDSVELEEAKKVIAQVELWNGKKMKKSFKNQSSAEASIKKMQDQEDVRGYNMYAEGLELGESTLNYGRTLKAIEKERKMKNISDEDKETLAKIAELMASLKENAKKDIEDSLSKFSGNDKKDVENLLKLYIKKDYNAFTKQMVKMDTSPAEFMFELISKADAKFMKNAYPDAKRGEYLRAIMYDRVYGKDESVEENLKKFMKGAKKKFIAFGESKNLTFKEYAEKNELDEKQLAGLKKKADETGIPYGILKKVFDRGMAAWKTGHRPGATPHQWAYARVNSFATKSKGTWGGADKDLAAKVK